MKNTIKLAVAAAMLAVGTAQSNAASATNLVQTITVKMTAYLQGAPTTNSTSGVITRNVSKASVATADIIKLIGLRLNKNFSTKAQLLLLTPMTGFVLAPQPGYVIIRDAGVDTNVNQYFDVNSILVVQGTTVKPTAISGNLYSEVDFHMAVPGIVGFDVAGFASAKCSTIQYNHQPVGYNISGTFPISGNGGYSASPGASQDVPTVLTGSITLKGNSTEVD